MSLEDQIHGAIEYVRNRAWPVNTFWYSDYINVGIGIDDKGEDHNGLSVQIEVIDPSQFVDVETLSKGQKMTAIEGRLGEVADDVRSAIETVVGHPMADDITYLGTAPTAWGTESLLFDATIQEAE